MKLPHRIIIVLFCAACIGALGWTANHYRENAIEYKKQRDEKSRQLKLANVTITDMQTRLRDVAALDAKYTKELADAKATIESLSADVAVGRRRLYLNATCTGTADTAASSGVVNAPAAELTPDARQNYFRLREQLATSEKQILGLQDYIRTQCLK